MLHLLPVIADSSSTLQTYKTGLSLRRKRSSIKRRSSPEIGAVLAGCRFSRCSLNTERTSSPRFASLSPALTIFSRRVILRSTDSRSLTCNSISTNSLSRTGSTEPSAWGMVGSSKQRKTCIRASTFLISDKNLLPSPFEPPLVRPGISTISTVVWITLSDLTKASILYNRSSGTCIIPRLALLACPKLEA